MWQLVLSSVVGEDTVPENIFGVTEEPDMFSAS
jgi:hypothetical protein